MFEGQFSCPSLLLGFLSLSFFLSFTQFSKIGAPLFPFMLILKGSCYSNSFAFVNIYLFCLETLGNLSLSLKSHSFTGICIRVNHSGLIFPGTQGAISMCRFRCFVSISVEFWWIIILIINSLSLFFLLMCSNNMNIIVSLPVFHFYYFLFAF